MLQQKNVGIAFIENAKQCHDHPAIISEDTVVTYPQLQAVTETFALHMMANGVDRGSIVTVLSEDLVVVLAAILSTALLGSKYVRFNPAVLQHEETRPTHFFHTGLNEGSGPPNAIEIDESWLQPPSSVSIRLRGEFPGYADENDGWFIANTSGTTGTPKFLMLSQSIMFDRAKAAKDDFKPFQTRSVCLFPVQSFPSIMRAITALLNRATIIHGSDFSLWRRSGANLVTASPNQIRKTFEEISLKQKLPVLHVGGARLDDSTASELLNNFETVVDLYGSTEANRVFKNIKTLDEHGNLLSTPENLDSNLEIVDTQGVQVSALIEGEVRIRNNYLAPGYIDAPEAGKKSFRDGWFYPGDTARWEENGTLTITGRTNDVFNIGGVKINANLLDAVMMSIDGIEQATCFLIDRSGNTPDIVAFAKIADGFDQKTAVLAAKNACNETLGALGTPDRIIPIDEIPGSTTGKPSRAACAEILKSKLRL